MIFNFHKEFEEISRIKGQKEDSLDDVLFQMGEKLCLCFNIERVNIWVFKDDPERIECIASYENQSKKFSKGQTIIEIETPHYFKHLKSDDCIIVSDINNNLITQEIKETYCKKHDIKAIMDVPIRIEGKVSGVICFEDCKSIRNWNEEEKNFALAVSQIVAQTIENQKRKKYQEKLLKALVEKDTLLSEMHHRLKNNLTLLIGLLRIQTQNLDDEKSLQVVKNFENQLFSISKIHEQLYSKGNFMNVNLDEYILQLVKGLQTSFEGSFKCNTKMNEISISSSLAVPIGLIINEILSNAIKHGMKTDKVIEISIKLLQNNNETILSISDNGSGFNFDQKRNESFGLNLIYELSEQLSAEMQLDSDENGSCYTLKMTI